MADSASSALMSSSTPTDHQDGHQHEHMAETDDMPSEEDLSITLTYHKEPITLSLPSSSTISDLSALITTDFDIPSSNQKLLISPKPGLLRPPFKDPTLPLSTLLNRKITLLGTPTSSTDALNSHLTTVRARATARATALREARKIKPTSYRDPRQAADEARYTFHSIRPLPYLPNPEKSQRYLERLASDPGIKAAMRKHKFSVGLLTEMNPAEHTTHESKTLGLNRNGGEVIELRLRTDDYDGYRDYKVIRKTLCHELAHNVHGPHERPFWDLMAEIEAEVKKGDWTRGGRSVGEQEFSRPGDEIGEDEVDDGGWTGGSYVLGTGEAKGEEGLSRREVMARAAEERLKRLGGGKEGGASG
ncbi:Ubiquitin and WLM domain-containing metalloprotease [Sphaceloma murrayae]|uniref:Ubiquitin and WLM domain-containing metalloprotease n=1 Tax=Sphaceloma murrayae TaxID=2082308 RepID=A0A2K1QZW4_9PEZI|nr:Ubiquitin and WLM domain-containing metalloprotease [Sphaceloma murrayae]